MKMLSDYTDNNYSGAHRGFMVCSTCEHCYLREA